MSDLSAEYLRGWNAAIEAVRLWHESQAKKTRVAAGRSRFPKNLEREAELHARAAEDVLTLNPDDV